MPPLETSATVGDQGQLHLTGIPFAPGTHVNVEISAKQPAEQASGESVERKAQRTALFAALDKARNTESVSNFQREDVYDR
jgi:hypothetical protein